MAIKYGTKFSPIQIDGANIEHSELFYESIVKEFPCPFYICDKHGHIQLHNQAAEELIEKTPKTVSDSGNTIYVHTDTFTKTNNDLDNFI